MGGRYVVFGVLSLLLICCAQLVSNSMFMHACLYIYLHRKRHSNVTIIIDQSVTIPHFQFVTEAVTLEYVSESMIMSVY